MAVEDAGGLAMILEIENSWSVQEKLSPWFEVEDEKD